MHIIILVGALALCVFCAANAVMNAKRNRAAGLTPDGAPLPRFGDFVRAMCDTPLHHGGRVLFVRLFFPVFIEGMVVRINDDLTMDVMDEDGVSHRCMLTGYFPIDTPEWYRDDESRENDFAGEVLNPSVNIVWPQSDKIH